MRTVAVGVLVVTALVASALDLALGTIWVAALFGVLLLRRRLRLAAPLVLLASAGLLVWGTQLGWLSRPAPAPYEKGWLPDWLGPRPEPAGAAADPRVLQARGRLLVVRRDELRLTGAELEQRAGAAILLSRRLDALRPNAPREIAAVEGAARRLARTLAAPEFRNLEARRAGVVAHLAELDRRLGGLHHGSDAVDVLRAADPAAMAHVSLRPVYEDLAAVDAAVTALVRALGAGTPSATIAATARYDETRDEVAWEARHAIAGAPGLRLVRIEMRAFRSAGAPGRPLRLSYASGDEVLRAVPPGDWMELAPGSRAVSIVAAWTDAPAVRPVRSTLRPIAFERLEIAASTSAEDAIVAAVLDAHPAVELPLAVRLPAASVQRITVPRHALYFATGAGAAEAEPDGDAWTPAGGQMGPIGLDLAPRTLLLRNSAFARVRPYLYRPNATALTAAVGVAAVTLILVVRRRTAPPERG